MKDYVPREALIALARPGTFATSCDGAVRQEDAVPVRVIQAIPAADVVEVRHGRWEVGGMFDDIGICSACHYMFPIDTATTEFHFCPNCGAKMAEV